MLGELEDVCRASAKMSMSRWSPLVGCSCSHCNPSSVETASGGPFGPLKGLTSTVFDAEFGAAVRFGLSGAKNGAFCAAGAV